MCEITRVIVVHDHIQMWFALAVVIIVAIVAVRK
jgi:hypothetical protein